MKKTISIVAIIAVLAIVTCVLTACSGGSAKAPALKESYYYHVARNHTSGEAYGVDLTDQLIRQESETLVLNDDGSFVITFTSSLAGMIREEGNPHEAGYVYQQQMFEHAVLTGKYTVKSEDSLMQTKTISLDSFTAFQHNNVTEKLSGANEDGITFTAKDGQTLTVNTETNQLSDFFEFYEGQYSGANTSY